MQELSRNELKQKAKSMGIEFKANANKTDLIKLITEHEKESPIDSSLDGQIVDVTDTNVGDNEIVDGFDDDNAVEDNGNGSNRDENDSDDKVVEVDAKNGSGANIGQTVKMKTCAGNFSEYPDTDEYFPKRFDGRYSVAYLRAKKLIK